MTEALTENPEDETNLNFSDELVDRPERLFEQRLDLLSSHVFVRCVDRRAEYFTGRRTVDGHGASLAIETERRQSEQDQKTDVRQRVCDEL